jgi:ABC-2 type transport system permease protein
MSAFKDDVCSDLRHVYINVAFELKKHWKKKRIPIVMLLAMVLPLIFYAVPPLLNVDYATTANGFASTNLGFISLLIVISAAMFTGDIVCSEFENRTGLLLFPTPQRQNSIFVGKYIAALISTWIAVSLYYLVTMFGMAQIYGIGDISIEFVKSFLLALIYSASAVSIIYFFSAVMKRSITSTLVGFFSLMMILPIITTVLSIGNVDPWFLVTHSSDLISDVLGSSGGRFGPGQVGDGGPAFGGASFSPDFYLGIAVMLAYAIGFFAAGLGIANRKKMEG